MNNLPWVDIETTGLDPNNDEVLEIGIIITGPYPEFRIVNDWQWILPLSPMNPVWDRMPDEVRKMHQDNGLLDLCHIAWENHVDGEIQDELVNFLKVNAADGMPMYGSGPHFDRAFLKVQYPEFEAAFSYRNFDVSTIRRFCNDIFGEQPWISEGNHRALDDLRETIANLIHARNLCAAQAPLY